MDLLTGAKRVICTMTHTTRDGDPKLLRNCEYPITSSRKVDMIITDLAVFKYIDGDMVLTEVMPGSSLEEIAEKTEARYVVRLEEVA